MVPHAICWPLASSIQWSLRLLHPLGILLTTPVVITLHPVTAPVVWLFTLSALFTESRVGKAQANRLETEERSQRNCRHIYSLLAGTAAVTADISITPRHSTQPLSWVSSSHNSVLSWLTLQPKQYSCCIPSHG